ncbi:MAG: hypothetical protein HN919_08655 [Verrucomicrobia bacterium]|jgi:hypothetical protein|nr:hypothetical protein [Verrucomicrobiota bacterium]MBT7066357.1 hypothetical protein [Verrucomicrobiota bacterium]
MFMINGGQYREEDDGSTLLNRMANVDIDKLVDWIEQHADSYCAQKDIPTSLEDTIKNWRDYGVFHLPHGGGYDISVVKDALASGDYEDRFGKHAQRMGCFGLFAARCNHGTVLINSNKSWGDCYDVIAESERRGSRHASRAGKLSGSRSRSRRRGRGGSKARRCRQRC